jgi:hypothetical protein
VVLAAVAAQTVHLMRVAQEIHHQQIQAKVIMAAHLLDLRLLMAAAEAVVPAQLVRTVLVLVAALEETARHQPYLDHQQLTLAAAVAVEITQEQLH